MPTAGVGFAPSATFAQLLVEIVKGCQSLWAKRLAWSSLK